MCAQTNSSSLPPDLLNTGLCKKSQKKPKAEGDSPCSRALTCQNTFDAPCSEAIPPLAPAHLPLLDS